MIRIVMMVSMMLLASWPALAQQTREQAVEELGERLARIQRKLNAATHATSLSEAPASYAEWSFELDPRKYIEALKEAEETARWITTNRYFRFTGMTASVSLPPSIDLHFDVLGEVPAE